MDIWGPNARPLRGMKPSKGWILISRSTANLCSDSAGPTTTTTRAC
jgi:hypothetical protein